MNKFVYPVLSRRTFLTHLPAFLFILVFFAAPPLFVKAQQACTDSFYVKFPADRLLTSCKAPVTWEIPVLEAPNTEFLATSFKDDTLWNVPDACYQIMRTWRVINWCYYDTNCAVVHIPNPQPHPVSFHPDNLPGPVVSGLCTGDPANPWTATVSKISPSDTAATEFCRFWRNRAACPNGSAVFNGYSYTQLIRVRDTEEPDIVECLPPDGNDVGTNDAQFWNSPVWWDPLHQRHDVSEKEMELRLIVSDGCTGNGNRIRYLLFLDTDNNGTQETVISSDLPQSAGAVPFDNAQNPQFAGGTLQTFDQRPLADPTLDAYQFALQRNDPPGKCETFTRDTAWVRFNTARHPDMYELPILPYGRHKIVWLVTDRCGNETTCERIFEVKDAKKPALGCRPVKITLQANRTAVVSTADIWFGASDNITPAGQLLYALIPTALSQNVFPVNAAGAPDSTYTFTCRQLGPQAVQLWVRDKGGNSQVCETVVEIQDKNNGCIQIMSAFGNVKTGVGTPLGGVKIAVPPNHPAFPPLITETDAQGRFTFHNLMAPVSTPGNELTVCAAFEDHPLNGVNVLDIAWISQHILSLRPLSPIYRAFSADVNKSGTITTLDIVGMYALILGQATAFPNNVPSWGFIDKRYAFTGLSNPLPDSLRNCGLLKLPQTDSLEFIGYKMGDVDDSALPNTLPPVTRTVYLDIPDQAFQTGDEIAVPVILSEPVAGVQFTLEHPGLELVSVRAPVASPKLLPRTASYPALQSTAGAWATDDQPANRPACTLVFRAKSTSTLQAALRLSDKVTATMAFASLIQTPLPGERLRLALRYTTVGTDVTTDLSKGFYAAPNRPNPFRSATALNFYLPEADHVTAQITDAAGRIVAQSRAFFAAGQQRFSFEDTRSWPSGVLYWQLTCRVGTATGKMVKVE